MDNIKTWQERRNESMRFPSFDSCIYSDTDVICMQEEITELRAALTTRTAPAPDAHATAKRIEHLLNTGGAPAPVKSIGEDAEFRILAVTYALAERGDAAGKAWDAVVAYIDSLLAARTVADAPAEPIILEEDHPEAARWYGMGYLDGTEQAASPSAAPVEQTEPSKISQEWLEDTVEDLSDLVAEMRECVTTKNMPRYGQKLWKAEGVIITLKAAAGWRAASPLPQGTPAAEVRDAALQEAANVCQNERQVFSDDEWRIRCDLAAAIRALSSQPDQKGGK